MSKNDTKRGDVNKVIDDLYNMPEGMAAKMYTRGSNKYEDAMTRINFMEGLLKTYFRKIYGDDIVDDEDSDLDEDSD